MAKLWLSLALAWSTALLLASQVDCVGVDWITAIKGSPNPIDAVLATALPILLGQQPNDINGTESWFEEYAINDNSNEDIGQYTPQQLITRAGFDYENHYSVSADGYITQLIRIINRLVDRRWLNQPPVMLMHGAFVDQSLFVLSSNIQHHPERYPRLPDDGPITSWNRSLAFVLANNGYDVWLVGTRGSNRQNQGHTKLKVYEPQGKKNSDPNKPINETFGEMADTLKYWDFSYDEIIEFELPAQIDRVLELTGSRKVSFLSYSFGCMAALSLFSSRPEYGERIHQHIVIAPVINNKGANTATLFIYKMIQQCSYSLGVFFFNEVLFTQPIRDLLTFINSDKELRYSLIKGVTTLMFGASPKYHSNLDSGVVGHIFEQVSFRQLQHVAQIMNACQFQKFDYGFIGNQLKYGSFSPPVYDFSRQYVDNWILFQFTLDDYATQASVQQVYETIRIKPKARFVVPFSNHADPFFAFTNDIHVNLPILDYLNEYAFPWGPRRPDFLDRDKFDGTDRELAKFVPGVYSGDSNGILDAQPVFP